MKQIFLLSRTFFFLFTNHILCTVGGGCDAETKLMLNIFTIIYKASAISDTFKALLKGISSSRPPDNPKTQNKEKITVQQNETKIVKNTCFRMRKKRISSLNSYFLYLWKTNLSSERRKIKNI